MSLFVLLLNINSIYIFPLVWCTLGGGGVKSWTLSSSLYLSQEVPFIKLEHVSTLKTRICLVVVFSPPRVHAINLTYRPTPKSKNESTNFPTSGKDQWCPSDVSDVTPKVVSHCILFMHPELKNGRRTCFSFWSIVSDLQSVPKLGDGYYYLLVKISVSIHCCSIHFWEKEIIRNNKMAWIIGPWCVRIGEWFWMVSINALPGHILVGPKSWSFTTL